MTPIHPLALFRLSVLGPLAVCQSLSRGELKAQLRALAAREYVDPEGRPVRLAEKTIERWYYAWRHGEIEALAPQPRTDRGASKIDPVVQEALLAAKRANPKRSLNALIALLEQQGVVGRGCLSRSSVHRLLQAHQLSRPTGASSQPQERRRFEADHAGDLWQGDVMHGPKVSVDGRLRKVYLVSLMDDASRLITHSAFCTDEGALAIEGVLKQALLKRGLPARLLLDNGPAYRSSSLQGICARLKIALVYCTPYQPEGKGKIERWHRTVREQFLAELDLGRVLHLDDLNARLWAWLDQRYHATPHGALNGLTPLQRYQQDLVHIRPLGAVASTLDALFYHRHTRTVRKDASVSLKGQWYEVDYTLVGQRVVLVEDPHRHRVVAVLDANGDARGAAVALDARANLRRRRQRPPQVAPTPAAAAGPNAVELALAEQRAALALDARGED
ncbi:DDE-type integrase/transposase/recombinase [Thiorhodococcus minor]|uniref:DDE-type integrase/transposase/recombinase n=1 Tax=Thiorhodococcus minor TaxID=57489 RepID=A0A6M0JYQ4_9GAMM|nr:DDE-type integrase/transposase/recombinase [Thiorhodococcus minor]NEV62648.1 DDE-type integrase/transposase/recombinase [Thiorhodococcus minor]